MKQDAVTLRLQVKEYLCSKLKGWDSLLARFAGVSINRNARVITPLFVLFKEVMEFQGMVHAAGIEPATTAV